MVFCMLTLWKSSKHGPPGTSRWSGASPSYVCWIINHSKYRIYLLYIYIYLSIYSTLIVSIDILWYIYYIYIYIYIENIDISIINHSYWCYWSYVHQLSDNELGQHLVATWWSFMVCHCWGWVSSPAQFREGLNQDLGFQSSRDQDDHYLVIGPLWLG